MAKKQRKARNAKLKQPKGRPKKVIEPLVADQSNLKNLRRAKGVIHAYKVSTASGAPPYNYRDGGPIYKVGGTYRVKVWDSNPRHHCGKGLNVATLDWCYGVFSRSNGYKLFLVEIKPKDIVCIPMGNTAKFRVKRFKILKLVKTF